MKLTTGQNLIFSKLVSDLVAHGYSRVELVVDQGDLAVRGGILDIFPSNHNTPLRLEFFGDTLESIRTFQVQTQLSLNELKETTISPVEALPHFLLRSSDFTETEDYLLPDFRVGDYVVHENYGIALFQGLTHLSENSVEGEYYHLQFAGSEAIYVPIDQSRLIHKYTGAEGKPVLTTLSDKSWPKAKTKAQTAAKDIAFDLFNLYRQRRLSPGYSFGEDSKWQAKMEEKFPYQETADQVDSIAAVKKDMQKNMPMDRLICGDVGFGKTEIAIRAAFKAAMAGKQVAVLAPTTILVSQHYHNFKVRFKDFGLEVRMLSRFHTQAQNRQIVQEIKTSKANIIVGTHRILQKDVQFKDLGLLIIDEEQRFGVEHKEYLKKLAVGADILTLSATPIPRTLYMSLSGVRDISILRTPPDKRRPIKTILSEYSDGLLKVAIGDELKRGGQIYFLNNDIKKLSLIQKKLLQINPKLKICQAHGKMPKHELEDTILAFIEKKYDLLLCTTIIENGIDIPNVNTIIVNNADHFGLAQLHQIRGRVGRSTVQAYAYLLYQKDKVLTTDSQERLQTLKEFTALGSGYRIAMKDLELRGAGNILGPQQSGYVQSVGFTLYMRMLEESIKEMKGEKITKEQIFSLPADQENYIPSDYMEEEVLRIAFYRRIMEAKDLKTLDSLEAELKDRFGHVPASTENLLVNIRRQIDRPKKVHLHPRYKK